jgi:hypothetical protein
VVDASVSVCEFATVIPVSHCSTENKHPHRSCADKECSRQDCDPPRAQIVP